MSLEIGFKVSVWVMYMVIVRIILRIRVKFGIRIQDKYYYDR